MSIDFKSKIKEAIELYELNGVHPAADLMPYMTDEEYEDLVKDVRERGFLHQVRITDDRLVIDGRNRLCASVDVGLDVGLKIHNPSDPIAYVMSENMKRRHLTASQRAMIGIEVEKMYSVIAKEKQRESGRFDGKNKDGTPKLQVPPNLAEPENKDSKQNEAREKAAKQVGVGHTLISDAKRIDKLYPELADKVREGKTTINAAITEIKERKIIEPKSKFNNTNESIDWAKYSWNPVTGCKFFCKYCYARDIAMRFNGHFDPEFHKNRLDAPKNTKSPVEPGTNNVFVCSMADLFGDWVSKRWINLILDTIRDNPQWNYLLLTKNPKRYLEFEFPKHVWLGATADIQKRADNAITVFNQISDNITFLSCEPLLEPISISYGANIHWVIIGGQSKTTGAPAFQPEWEWVENLLIDARKINAKVFFKPNLSVRPQEKPF